MKQLQPPSSSRKPAAIKGILSAILLGMLLIIPDIGQAATPRENVYLSPEVRTPEGFTSIAATWKQPKDLKETYDLTIRFREKNAWTSWYHLEPDIDNLSSGENMNLSAFFATNYSEAYQYRIIDYSSQANLNLLLNSLEFIPIHQKPQGIETFGDLVASLTTDIDETFSKLAIPGGDPNIISRRKWGADESLRVYKGAINGNGNGGETGESKDPTAQETAYDKFLKEYADEVKIVKIIEFNEKNEYLTWPQEYPEKIRKIFIHHTATSKNLDNPKQAIRDIYFYHAVTRKWGDIGYNYVIDQQGNIYEGRSGGEGVVGAHVAKGNTGSIGIAILGNYENEEISDGSFTSLVQLLASKSKLHDIDPFGKSSFRGVEMENIVGHRDYGKTACPGINIYSRLPLIREMVAETISGKSSTEKSYVKLGRLKGFDYQLLSRPDKKLFAQKNKKFTFVIKLKNSGQYDWKRSGTQGISLVDSGGETVGRLVENEVATGQIGTFDVKATAPDSLGDQRFKVIPVIGDGNRIDNASIAVDIHVFEKLYSAELVETSPHAVYGPGEADMGWIKLKNTGGETWYRYGQNDLYITMLAPVSLEILRTRLFESSVEPGQVGTVVFTLKVPEREGDYSMFLNPWFAGHPLMEGRIAYPIRVSNDPASIVPLTREIEKKATKTTSSTTVSKSAKTAEESSLTGDLLRVVLSFHGNPVITGDGPFSLYGADEKIAVFEKNEEVEITKETDKYKIKSGRRAYLSSQPPRFVPDLQTIMEIRNFQNPPAWNPNLNDNRYRGTLEINEDDGQIIVINELPIEAYLRGIGEVSNTSPYEKIKAITVAARSYATYYTTIDRKFPGKPYDLSSDPERSQKYLGFGLEERSPNIVRAVKETTGEVVKYNGKVVKSPYFNQSAGHTLSAKEVWGWTNTPYLVSVPDPYCKADKFLGHGVGLSGCGAEGMAAGGKNYKEILKYYYQGVEISKYH